jgi:predicted nucleotidyltransferase
MTEEAVRDHLLSLLRRMNHFGSLLRGELGGDDDIAMAVALEDPDTRVDVAMIVDEMFKAEAEVYALLEAVKAQRERLAAGR